MNIIILVYNTKTFTGRILNSDGAEVQTYPKTDLIINPDKSRVQLCDRDNNDVVIGDFPYVFTAITYEFE